MSEAWKPDSVWIGLREGARRRRRGWGGASGCGGGAAAGGGGACGSGGGGSGAAGGRAAPALTRRLPLQVRGGWTRGCVTAERVAEVGPVLRTRQVVSLAPRTLGSPAAPADPESSYPRAVLKPPWDPGEQSKDTGASYSSPPRILVYPQAEAADPKQPGTGSSDQISIFAEMGDWGAWIPHPSEGFWRHEEGSGYGTPNPANGPGEVDSASGDRHQEGGSQCLSTSADPFPTPPPSRSILSWSSRHKNSRKLQTLTAVILSTPS
nr:WAS/WASL-interacting protein family member 1-like [Equus asinus]